MSAGPLELGLGALEVLAAGGAGRVDSVFAKAAYLRLPGGLFALTGFEVPSGPVHARASASLSRLRAGDPVVAAPSLLQAGPLLVTLDGARVWRGHVASAAELEAGRELALGLLRSAPLSALEGPVVDAAMRSVTAGDMEALAALLGGLGPGLTPAGDDALAGILLVAAFGWGEAAQPLLARVADGVRTNDVSLEFLRWAARGQSIEPVHRFLAASAGGDTGPAAAALGDLVSFGHSSGADMALGLRLALELLPARPAALGLGRCSLQGAGHTPG